MQRAGQITWVLDHEADVASDMSAFHRVDDHLAMPGPRFFSLAHRLPAYRGVLRLRAEQVISEDAAATAAVTGGATPSAGAPAGGRVQVDATAETLAGTGLSDLFEVGHG